MNLKSSFILVLAILSPLIYLKSKKQRDQKERCHSMGALKEMSLIREDSCHSESSRAIYIHREYAWNAMEPLQIDKMTWFRSSMDVD